MNIVPRPGEERAYMRPLVDAAEMLQPNLDMLNPMLDDFLDRLEPMEGKEREERVRDKVEVWRGRPQGVYVCVCVCVCVCVYYRERVHVHCNYIVESSKFTAE